MAKELKVSHSTLEQRVAHRTEELSALYDVTTTVNQSLDLETVLQEVIRKITSIFNFDATRVLLLDSAMKELRLRASYEISPEFAGQVTDIKRGGGDNRQSGTNGRAHHY